MKPFLELYKHDFKKEIKKKPTFYKDSTGKFVPTHESKWLSYIEWATVLVALYNVGGAQSVTYQSDLHPNKKNTLKIHLCIDGVDYFSDYPIIDGSTVIDNPNQMNTHKAESRGFVKCVAIHTGLGLSLWQKEESHLNELPPSEHKTAKPEVEDNTILFMEWNDSIKNCETVEALGILYTKNKEVIEGSKPIMALFLNKKAEFKAKELKK